MTKRSDFKKQVRARMDETGERYSTARDRLLAQPPPASAGGTSRDPSRQGWSIAEALWVDEQGSEGPPCVKEPFATQATPEELAFGFEVCALPNPDRVFRESSRVQAVAIEFFDPLRGRFVAFKLTSGDYGIRPPQMHPIDIEDAATLDDLERRFSNSFRRAPTLVTPPTVNTDGGGPGRPREDLRRLMNSRPKDHTALVPDEDPRGGPYSWPMVVEGSHRVPTFCEQGWRRFDDDLATA